MNAQELVVNILLIIAWGTMGFGVGLMTVNWHMLDNQDRRKQVFLAIACSITALVTAYIIAAG